MGHYRASLIPPAIANELAEHVDCLAKRMS